MMFRKLLSTIRSKKTNQPEPKMHTFDIVENGPTQADFEFTELTHEEYVKFIGELRHLFRKQ